MYGVNWFCIHFSCHRLTKAIPVKTVSTRTLTALGHLQQSVADDRHQNWRRRRQDRRKDNSSRSTGIGKIWLEKLWKSWKFRNNMFLIMWTRCALKNGLFCIVQSTSKTLILSRDHDCCSLSVWLRSRKEVLVCFACVLDCKLLSLKLFIIVETIKHDK